MKYVHATIKLFNSEGRQLTWMRCSPKIYKHILRGWQKSYPAYTSYSALMITDEGDEMEVDLQTQTIIKKAA